MLCGKAIVSSEDTKPAKMDVEVKKRQRRDYELIEPLSIDCEDLSKLPEIGCLEYYKHVLDRRVHLHTVLKYPKTERSDNMIADSRVITRNSLKAFRQRYHICSKNDIIPKCKLFFNRHYPRYIQIYKAILMLSSSYQ